MALKRNVWVALTMYLALVAFYWSQSGASIPVKLVDAIPLTFGFLVPAVFLVRGVSDFKGRFLLLLTTVLASLFVYDILITRLVVKHDLFYWWYIVYPLGTLFLMGLLFVHSLISRSANRESRDGAA